MVVLDHHETAERELADLDFCVFDMEKSGARLTWEWLQPGFNSMSVEPHWLVRYTEDRDLWQWKLPSSREVNASLRTFPFDFKEWRRLAGGTVFHETAASTDSRIARAMEGEGILRGQQQVIDSHVRFAKTVGFSVKGRFQTWKVVNATTLISEIAGTLAAEHGVGCCWFERSDGARVYSLRTTKEHDVDVGAIAKGFGGGGHRAASGFTFSADRHPWEG